MRQPLHPSISLASFRFSAAFSIGMRAPKYQGRPKTEWACGERHYHLAAAAPLSLQATWSAFFIHLGQELVGRGSRRRIITTRPLMVLNSAATNRRHRHTDQTCIYIHHFVVHLDEERLFLCRVEATPRGSALPSMSFCWNT